MFSLYGLEKVFKNYANYPSFLPFEIEGQHGVPYTNLVNKYEVNTDKGLFFAVNEKEEALWKENSSKPVVIAGYHQILYKKMNKIVQDEESKGTVAFPFHSTESFYADFDLREYVNELLKLPEKYQPITICMYNDDIFHWKKHKEIEDLNVNIVTAGAKSSYSFQKNFYNILKSHKYATSNSSGTFIFLAIDLGLPFFYTGKISTMKKFDKELDFGFDELNENKDDFAKFIRCHFEKEPTDIITSKQKELVSYMLGKKYIMPPYKLGFILWREYIRKYKFGVVKDFYRRWNSHRIFKSKLQKLRKQIGEASVYLYGAGSFLKFLLSVDTLAGLDVRGVIDSNAYFHGWSLLDYMICSVDEIKDSKPDYIFISAVDDESISAHLEKKIKEYNLKTKIIRTLYEGEYWI